jgi:uncharacterized cofD-like protein
MRILLGTADPSFETMVRGSSRRFGFEWVVVSNGLSAFHRLMQDSFDLVLLDFELSPTTAPDLLQRLCGLSRGDPPPAIVLTHTDRQRTQVEAAELPRTEVLPALVPPRLLIDRMIRILKQKKRVVCLGGGTGLFTLLSGLKTIPGLSLTSIVSMSDDGGSTGRLRDRFGMLPPGDVRRSLVALSSAPHLLNQLMQYRFTRGEELQGHNLGNLMLTALSEMRGTMSQAVSALGEILNIQGKVVPVTDLGTTLKARLRNGTLIEGENRIDVYEAADENARIEKLWCDPAVPATPAALAALSEADLIVLGPGDLFTSIISNLVISGVPEAIRESRGQRVFVCNVMTEPGETCGFSVLDHVREAVSYLGADCLDFVLASSTQFSAQALEHYARLGQTPVVERPGERIQEVSKARVVRADVASESSLVRHDSLKLALAMREFLDIETADRRIPSKNLNI